MIGKTKKLVTVIKIDSTSISNIETPKAKIILNYKTEINYHSSMDKISTCTLNDSLVP